MCYNVTTIYFMINHSVLYFRFFFLYLPFTVPVSRCFPFISVQYAFTKQDLLCPSQFTTAGNKFALKCVGEVFSNQSALELH